MPNSFNSPKFKNSCSPSACGSRLYGVSEKISNKLLRWFRDFIDLAGNAYYQLTMHSAQ